MNRFKTVLIYSLVITFLGVLVPFYANDNHDGLKLLNDYVFSKGYFGTIIFDSSNIKQFWIDQSISLKDASIMISLNNDNVYSLKSVPLKIQLANVYNTQDCKVDIISSNHDFSFFITNKSNAVVSESSKENDFIQYSVLSSTFHLENTPDFSFYINFHSNVTTSLPIKMIILSFSNNTSGSFLPSPCKLSLSKDTFFVYATNSKIDDDFVVTGKNTVIISKKNCLVSNNTFQTSSTIKNTGDTPTTVFLGYAPYTKEGIKLDGKNYPYNDSCVTHKVISAEKGSNTIVIDSYSEWEKGCYLAINANEDFSDIPNSSLIDGRISEVKKLPNGQCEITMDKPLNNSLKAGTSVRIHGLSGAYLYTDVKRLQPGETVVFNTSIKKDDSFIKYSKEAFSKGVYYVKPLILSYSIDPNSENTILITDYSINY